MDDDQVLQEYRLATGKYPHAHVLLVDGNQMVALAAENDGWVPITLQFREHWSPAPLGRAIFNNVILIDWTADPDLREIVFYHELGHIDYLYNTPLRDLDDTASELHARVFSCRTLLDKGRVEALKLQVKQSRSIVAHADEQPPHQVDADRRFMSSDLWREVLAVVDESHI